MNDIKHPIQPLYTDSRGVTRFKGNKIVGFLLENGGYNMNSIAGMNFSNEDREQFAQLIGYSLGGFGELDYVSDETYETAILMSKEGISEEQSKIKYLEDTLIQVRAGLKIASSAVFKIHPDDLEY
jgi:hypothetical protein